MYVPTAQARHFVESGSLYVPGGQSPQPLDAILECVPAGQIVQLLLPVVEYFPSEHAEHVVDATFGAKYPLLQSLHVPAPTGYVNLPTGHTVQTTDPTELNVPALQSVHLSAAPFETVPAAQGVQDGLPGAENFPAGHAEHVTVPLAAAK